MRNKLSTLRARKTYAAMLLAAAAGVMAIAALILVPGSDRGGGASDLLAATDGRELPSIGADMAGRPTLDVQISDSEVIVVARVVKIGEPYEMPVPGVSSEFVQKHGVPSHTFTDVTFEVSEYLKGSGPSEFVTVQRGDLSLGGFAEFPAPKLQKDMLVFLVRAPAVTYGGGLWLSLGGPWGQVFEEDGEMRYGWGTEEFPSDVPELSGRDFEASTIAVRDAVLGEVLSQ